MYSFSNKSLEKLLHLDERLRLILDEAIKIVDFTVIETYRTPEDQLKAYANGTSHVKFGKHNHKPSLAVDIAPYPVDWANKKAFYYLAGVIMAIAHRRGVKLRWGGDWNGDNNFDNQKFYDLPHFEIDDEDNHDA